MSPYAAEFFGTFLFILLGNGVVASVVLKGTKSENAGWLTIVIGWGLAISLTIYAIGKFSGAHLNPAVTIALAYAGNFPWEKVLGYSLAQLAGAFMGAIGVWVHYRSHWGVTTDPQAKLAAFSTSPAIRSPLQNLLCEIIATAVLVLALLFIGANSFAEGLNPLVIGVLITSMGLSFGGTTGFALNPARDLGPRLAHFILPIPGKGNSDWTYAWIPVAGPIAGGLAGAIIYRLLFN